ncbi:MAG: hypothetical protein NTW86_16760 [Candidatus Sumerlaeota bacterium]|nr:hypothetical protein [Candidatus Sumerlaeota bacterium]
MKAADAAVLYSRIGVRGARREVGYCPSGTPDYDKKMAELTEVLNAASDQNITVMLTLHAGSPKYGPMERGRPHLNDKDETIGGKTDQAWLPEYGEDFQTWVALVVRQFGWPHGPVNAVELWNEPWEGLSISGWQADIPRYRDLYTRMARGVEEARAADPSLRVLIGGCCSSPNTLDKLFCDGSDQFLKWLDFASIHYQPLGAWPSLYPEWVNRQGPNGPVRCWDTESWVANSEDRVAAVIASMRAQGQERTAGVLHDAVCGFVQAPPPAAPESPDGSVRNQSPSTSSTPSAASTPSTPSSPKPKKSARPPARPAKPKEAKTFIPQAWAPAAAVGAMQNLLGQRKFKEILFKNGLPWVFVFDGLLRDGAPNPDDGTVVVVGDLAGVYEHEKLLFWSVQGLSELKNAAEVKKLQNRLVMLPKKDKSVREERDRVLAELAKLQTLEGAAMTIADGGGKFVLYDFYGNPQP